MSTQERIADLQSRLNYINAKIEACECGDPEHIDLCIERSALEEQLNFAWQDDEAEYNYALECQEFNPDGSLALY